MTTMLPSPIALVALALNKISDDGLSNSPGREAARLLLPFPEALGIDAKFRKRGPPYIVVVFLWHQSSTYYVLHYTEIGGTRS